MELHLGLALSSSSSSASSQFDLNSCDTNHNMKKRKHDEDDDDRVRVRVRDTLPLLVSNNFSRNQNYDSDDEVESDSIFVHQRNVGGMIGWPPVKLCRRKVCHLKIGNGGGSDGQDDGDDDGDKSKSTFVKVHMEGIGIARKVDLNVHHSYQTLVHTLATMFGKCYEDVKLTYQDKEGDWLLAGDVPWGSFIKTIQRLKLVKK